jgi:hypothetical protein
MVGVDDVVVRVAKPLNRPDGEIGLSALRDPATADHHWVMDP